MKSCPSCHQVYPDDGPDYCTNDGSPLARSDSQYNPAPTQGGQWQPPPPQGYGYPPAGGYAPPYGYPQRSRGAGRGVSKAALFTGIGSGVMLLLAIIVIASSRPSRDALAIVGILGLLMLLSSIAAIVLGIIALSMASRDSGVSKASAIVGLCLGVLPLLLWLVGIASAGRRF